MRLGYVGLVGLVGTFVGVRRSNGVRSSFNSLLLLLLGPVLPVFPVFPDYRLPLDLRPAGESYFFVQ